MKRQRIRLTQIQDIAGVRVLATSVVHQDQIVQLLCGRFSASDVDDRRVQPSHGYRAVHVIVPLLDRLVEIQIRTREQHLWAELSEKLSDVFDPNIKYGGGPEWVRENLSKYSALTARIEVFDRRDADSAARLGNLEADQRAAINRGENKDTFISEIVSMKLLQQNQERMTWELKEILADVLTEQYNSVRRKQP